MKKRLMALCMAVVMTAVVFTVAGIKKDVNVSDVSYAQRNTYAEGETVQSTAQTTLFNNPVDGFIGNKVDGASNAYDIVSDIAGVAGDIGGSIDMGGLGGDMGGLGDALGGIGDVFGGVFGGGGNTPQSTQSVTYSVVETTVGQIQVVPAATQNYGSAPVTIPSASTPSASQSSMTTMSLNTAETVDFAAVANPYQKPTGELKGGDTGEGVKWMQWIFIYTRYGLKDDGITGVFDEDTMAVVKKLQKENNMTVNGIVNDAVIDKIEKLYYASTYTQPTVVATTGGANTLTSPVVVPEQDNTVLILLFVVVLLAWILVIVFVVTIIMKSKKKKAKAKKNEEKTDVAEEKSETPEENK